MLLIKTSSYFRYKNNVKGHATPIELWDTALWSWGVWVKMEISLLKLYTNCVQFGKGIPIFTHTPQLQRAVSQSSIGVGRTSWPFYGPKLGKVSICNTFRIVWGIKNPPWAKKLFFRQRSCSEGYPLRIGSLKSTTHLSRPPAIWKLKFKNGLSRPPSI